MRTLLLALSVTLSVCLAPGSAPAAEPLKLTGQTMGTYYSIVVDSPTAAVGDGTDLQTRIESRLQEINSQMSTWDKTSQISAFNRSTSTDWFDVSAEFAQVAVEAKKIHELTGGAFDPTVAPLIDLWGFGTQRRKSIPDEAAIARAMQSVGMQHLSVRTDPPALKKAMSDLQLNLSAIAKGYAVDALAELLLAEGLPSHVVDIGGENRAGTAKSSGSAWKLGVESPLGGLHRIMQLTEMSIATSGDYRNNFRVDDVVYSHAINPFTGSPVINPPASVSVVHRSCMTADAWATAMMVLGTSKGVAVAESNNLSVMFQEVQVDRSIAESSTGLFAQAAASESPANKPAATEPAATEPAATEPGPDDESAGVPETQSFNWFPFAAAALIFLTAIGGLAIGTILQNRSLKGSCGGLASMPGSDGKSICDLCTVPKDECTNAELREQLQAAAGSAEDNG